MQPIIWTESLVHMENSLNQMSQLVLANHAECNVKLQLLLDLVWSMFEFLWS